MLVSSIRLLSSIAAADILFEVLYYSNNILSKALPDLGPYVSLGITIVNFFMTAAPIFLIDVRPLLVPPLRLS